MQNENKRRKSPTKKMEILSSTFDSLSLTDDHTYAEELQLQEALEASLNMSSKKASTSSQQISCEICTEDKSKSDMFEIEGCPHSFCAICISKHIEYKLQENIIFISCPNEDCNNTIEPRSLRSIVPKEVVARWEEAIIESTILDSEKIHCPYENCSEILVNDFDDGSVITKIKCPNCRRLFCAACKVPWHEGFDCKEFKRLKHNKKEKEELRLLAREKKWKKCPHCKVFVDKNEGCIHMTCWCKFEFCYKCGATWDESHWNTCQEK